MLLACQGILLFFSLYKAVVLSEFKCNVDLLIGIWDVSFKSFPQV